MAVQHYSGGCQCGAVRFEVDLDIDHMVTCNCSRCGRIGSILAFAPQEAFTLVKGEDQTTEYLFNSRTIHHRFCTTCGVESYAMGQTPDGTKMAAVNVRCLDGIDVFALKPTQHDGASR